MVSSSFGDFAGRCSLLLWRYPGPLHQARAGNLVCAVERPDHDENIPELKTFAKGQKTVRPHEDVAEQREHRVFENT